MCHVGGKPVAITQPAEATPQAKLLPQILTLPLCFIGQDHKTPGTTRFLAEKQRCFINRYFVRHDELPKSKLSFLRAKLNPTWPDRERAKT